MSGPGFRPAVAQPRPQPGRGSGKASSDVPLWVLLAAVAVMLGLAGGVLVMVRGARPEPAPTYPAHWDSRIAPYARIAEHERGLFFLHPVAVRFLPAAQFEKTVTADEKDLQQEDRTEIARFTGLMRAFGLLRGGLNLSRAVNDVKAGETLAYYSFADRTITVRGQRITPAIRSTLVHELTHVLQDQRFHVGDRLAALRAKDAKGSSTSESSVLDAIVEGDAERVETLYRAGLNARQRAALDAGRKGEATQALTRIRRVPKVIVTLMTSPYTLGQALVETAAVDGGNTAVDKLLRSTPTHDAALLDPFRVLAGDADAVRARMPSLAAGEKKFDSGEFGALTWYLMLAERLPLLDALSASDGWGSDAYVAFERGGTACGRMSYAGRTRRDTTRMYDALRRWAAAAPGSPARVRRTGSLLSFESCDPGRRAEVGKDASQDAVALATTRTYLGVTALRLKLPQATAACLSRRLVRTYPVDRLTDPTFGARDPAVQARVAQLASACR